MQGFFLLKDQMPKHLSLKIHFDHVGQWDH